MQEEDLSLALQLAFDGVANDAFVITADHRLDRQPVERRRFDRGHVLHADERKVERARNRSGR